MSGRRHDRHGHDRHGHGHHDHGHYDHGHHDHDRHGYDRHGHGEDHGRPRLLAPLRWILAAVLPPEDRRPMGLEMEVLYRRRRERSGRLRADLWFAAAVGGFVGRMALMGAGRWLRDAGADVRYGVRVLGRRPAYALTAVLTLGLGVGGLTAAYAVADWVLLRGVPGVTEPQRLVTLRKGSTESERVSWGISHRDLEALRDGLDAAASLAAHTPLDVNLAFDRGLPPLRVPAAAVTRGWFETLGVRFAAGRPPSSAPEPWEAGRGEVVLAWDVAASLASRAPEALGRTILVDGRPHRVVGVTERGFRGAELPGRTRAWLGAAALVDPDSEAPADRFVQGHREIWSLVVGRLAPGVSAERLEAEGLGVVEELRRSERPNSFSPVTHFTLQVFPGVGLDPGLRGPVRRTVGLLVGGAAFLLLLAGLNLANLAVTHAASRRAATAVRRALGAGRGRIVRQVLAEHAVLGAAGAVAGLAVATLGVHLFRGVRLEEFGAALEGLELGSAAWVGMGLALGTALIAGLAVALRGGDVSGSGGLRTGRDASPGGRRLRTGLAAAQVALSTVLVVGAGLMARTVGNLRALELGFEPDGILAFTVDPSRPGEEGAVPDLLERLTAEIEAEPGVEAAGFVFPEPLRTSYLTSWLGRPDDPDGEGTVGAHLQVAGHFLEAMGAGLRAGSGIGPTVGVGPGPGVGPAGPGVSGRPGGRGFRAAPGERSVLMTRAGVRAVFPERTAGEVVGASVVRPRDPDPVRVAGVLEDLRLTGPREDPPPVFVVPWEQGFEGGPAVGWVRVRSGSPAAVADAIRRAVRRVDPTLPVYDVRTAREQADRMVAGQRVLAGLVTAVALLGLVLAAVGLHGVQRYAVTQRRREIGIRTALGADPGRVRGRVLGGGLAMACAGLVPGLLGAASLTRLLEAHLYGVEPLDPATYVVGSAVLLAVAGLASWAPARGATRVPVVEVLRAE